MYVYKVSSGICQWKNFDNQSTTAEVTDKSLVVFFFWDTVYTLLLQV